MRKLLALLAALIVGLAGCGDGKAPDTPDKNGGKKKTLTVGFSQCGSESSWRTAETASVQEEAKKRGITLKYVNAQGKQENQIKALKSFVAQGVDAIILAPKTKSGWDTVLREVKAAKIPIVLVDRGIKTTDESLYETLIASDFVAEGRMAGEWLAKKTGGKCKIIQLEGEPGSDPANDREKGFKEAIAKHPGMLIIASQTALFKRSEGRKVMADLINAHGKDIEAVYAHNDDMAIGAIQALDAAGMKPGKDVIVLSIDAVKDAFHEMIKGTLNCTVECNPLLGPKAFDAVDQILGGKTLPKRITIQDQVFEAHNAAEVIKTRKY